MLKWTVRGAGGGAGTGRSPGPGPCCSIRRAAAKLSRHRARRSASADKENFSQGESRPSPRRRDSIYMSLDAVPVALRDVSNCQSVRSPEGESRGRSRSPRLKRSRSAVRLQTPTHLLGRDHEGVLMGTYTNEFASPAKKKQPCSHFGHIHQSFGLNDSLSTVSERSDSSPHIDYSPCPLKVTQSLAALRQKMTDSLPFLAQGISLDNPLYYALNQSPSPSPVDLINKEIPTTKKKDSSETPTNARDIMRRFSKHLNLGLNESDESKLSPKKDSWFADQTFSLWMPQQKPKTSEVSPLARKLAWLRLSNQEKSDSHKKNLKDDLDDTFCESKNLINNEKNGWDRSIADKSFSKTTPMITKLEKNNSSNLNSNSSREGFPEPFSEGTQWNSAIRKRIGNIVTDSSVINILSTNHDRQKQNFVEPRPLESSSVNGREQMEADGASLNPKREMTNALKRRGVVFNEQTFALNTPPASDSDERWTKTSSCCTSIDLDEPSTLKRQRVIRRKRLRSVSENNLNFNKRLAKRHPISFLTLPKGVPSPFDVNADNSILNSIVYTPKSTKSKSVPHLGLSSSKKVTFGSIYDMQYSDSGSSSSFFGLTLPKGIPSPPSPSDEEIPGVRPLDDQRADCSSNKRKSDAAVASECSEETWDSHMLQLLKTPRLADAFDDTSFADSSRMKSPSFLKNAEEEDNDDDFSSLASSTATSSSPLHMTQSRRCLSFTSPSKRNRSWKRIMGRGELEVTLQCTDNILVVHVHRGRNLGRAGADQCNAYVKLSLVAGKDHAFLRTCVRKYSNNPRFDHRFTLELKPEDFERRVLVSAWHRDRSKRRSEFLGCMSFAVKQIAKKEVSGSYRLLSQACGRSQHVSVTNTADHATAADAMANQSESSVEECVSIEESDAAPTPDPAHDRRTSSSTKKEVDKTTNEDSVFLRHLELDPPPEPVKGAGGGGVGVGGGGGRGRTPFTTTRRLARQPGTSFGFSIAWTHPPRVERVEAGLPADQAGLRPGDYVIFVDKTNVVTLPEEEILKLIKACGNQLVLEVYRKVSANGTVGRGSLLPAPPRSSTACSAATTATATATAKATATASLQLTKRRLHLPQVTFTSEGGAEGVVENRCQAVYQLLRQEQQYALSLQFGIARFLLPLSERRDVISNQDHSVLFQNAQELLRLSEDILEMLIQEDGDRFGTSLGRIYLRKMNAVMNGYRRYCAGLKKADCLLVEKTRNPAFMRLITEPSVPRRRPDLTTFVHKPLEHFRDTLKSLHTIQNYTSSKDDDYPAVSRVVNEFQAAYKDITLESGLMEPEVEGRPLLSLQDLESRLVFTRCKPFTLSAPGRQWIFGGDLSRVEGRSVRPFWALLFTDLLLFAKVSRDRVLFVTEEPLSLLTVNQALFSIRKKATEFRLLLSSTPAGYDSPAVGGCAHIPLPELALSRTPRRGPRRRTVALRAPTAELKAVWQTLIQRQIAYLNTRGGTPASSPLDSPDPLTADSVATLDSLSLQRQAESQSMSGLDELIEHRCRQLGKSGSNKGSAMHLAQWMKGQLGGSALSAPLSPDAEPEPEVWSPATLRRRRDQLGSALDRYCPRNVSRCEDLDVSDHERSTSRCTEHSTTEDSQNTIRTPSGSERPVGVCRQCHTTCLVNNNINTADDINANNNQFSSLDDASWGPLTEAPPCDPFTPVPHISVLPPSPPTSLGSSPLPLPHPGNNNWPDADHSSTAETSTLTPKGIKSASIEEEEESDGEVEEPPYRSLSFCGLRRYGTVSSLERLEGDPDADLEDCDLEDSDGNETGHETDDLPADGVVGGQLESVSQSLRGWTIRAGHFVAEKMALFERLGDDTRATSFFDRYLRSLPDQEVFTDELAATSTSLAGEDECETSGGTSGEDIWGTPTSGDSGLTSPTLELCPDCPLGSAADDAREQLMMEELLGGVGVGGMGVAVVTLVQPMHPTRTTFPQRRRLEPLVEDEEDSSSSEEESSSTSPDISENTKSYSTDQGNRSDSCVVRGRSNTSPSNQGFFTRLRLRRSHSAESRSNRGSKILQFLRSTKSEESPPSTSSGGRLMRLFSRDSTDDIPTTIPPSHPITLSSQTSNNTGADAATNGTPPKKDDKTLERRFWKQLRRRRTTHTDSVSPKSSSIQAS